MASRIVRGEAAPEPGTEHSAVIDAQVLDAREQAARILAEAARRADELRARAASEREAALGEARAQGRQQGLAEAAEVLLRARLERQAMLDRAMPEVLQLALAIAGRIASCAAELDPRLAADIAARAIEPLRTQGALVLRVNPADAEALRASRERLLDGVGKCHALTLREDPAIRRGGCVVESETATIDARLETQLEMIGRVLGAG